MARRPNSAGTGFAMVDLLAVLAVVAVLGAVAGIPLARSKQTARLAVCLANLQSVARGLQLYAGDSHATLPDTAPVRKDIWWWYKDAILPYATKAAGAPSETLFACPNDRGYSDPTPFCKTARFDFNSYVFNGVTLPGMPNIAGWKLSAVAEPRRTLLAMEWTAHAPLSWHRSRTGSANAPFYSGAESATSFVDGHAALTRIYYDGFNAAYTRDPISGYDYRYSGN